MLTIHSAYPILGLVTFADLANDVEAFRLDLLAGAERAQGWIRDHPLIGAAAACLLMLVILVILNGLHRTREERIERRDIDRERFVAQVKAETKPRPVEVVVPQRQKASVVATMATLRAAAEAGPVSHTPPRPTVSETSQAVAGTS